MFYSSSLTLLSVADSIRPLRGMRGQRLLTLVLLLGVSSAIALLSSAHFATQFGEFLAILLYLFTPWSAINLVDFYFGRRGHYSVREIFNPHGLYGRWACRSLDLEAERRQVALADRGLDPDLENLAAAQPVRSSPAPSAIAPAPARAGEHGDAAL